MAKFRDDDIEEIDNDQSSDIQDVELKDIPDVQEAANEDEAKAEDPTAVTEASNIQKYKDLLAKSSGQSPVVSRMNTGDAINSLLGKRSEQLNSAQNLRNNLQLLAGLQHAGQTIGSAFVPMSNVRPNEQLYQSQMAAAERPIQDVMTRQSLLNQATKDVLMHAQAQKQMAYQDPSSPESEAFRKAVMTINPGIAKVYGDSFKDITAADKELIFDPIKLKEQIDARKDIAEQNRMMKQSTLQAQMDNKRSDADSKARQAVFSFRGNAGAQQASKDVLSTAKALDLINQPGIKTTQDLQLIAQELGKVASGGVPGAHEIYALLPSNLKTKTAELINFISSKPTNAQADEYLQRNKKYLNEIRSTAVDTLKNYQLNMAKGFKNKMHPDEYSDLQKDISSQYSMPESIKTESHPQDDAAIAWAKANPSDPRSAQILKVNGM
jgi:hypothetical protein